MLRMFVGTVVVALVICAGSLPAEEIKGKVAKVDAEKKTLTLTVDGKDQSFPIDKEAKFLTPGKKKQLQDLPGGLSGVKEGTEVTLTTEKKDGKETITKVTVEGRKKKKPAQSPAAQDTGTKAPDRQIAWLATWKQALAEAKRTEKPILLAFGKPACEGVPGLW